MIQSLVQKDVPGLLLGLVVIPNGSSEDKLLPSPAVELWNYQCHAINGQAISGDGNAAKGSAPPTFVKVIAQVPPETASLATWKVFPVLLKLML